MSSHSTDCYTPYAKGKYSVDRHIWQRNQWAVYSPEGVCIDSFDSRQIAQQEADRLNEFPEGATLLGEESPVSSADVERARQHRHGTGCCNPAIGVSRIAYSQQCGDGVSGQSERLNSPAGLSEFSLIHEFTDIHLASCSWCRREVELANAD